MSTQRGSVSARQVLILGIGAVALLIGGLALSEEPESSTRASMRGIFVTLSSAYVYSLDADAFSDPENRDQITLLLDALATNADQLEDHSTGLDPSFDYLKRSLSRDAHDALDRFKTKNYVGSRFVLSKITENCVTCHTKLPAGERFDVGAEFLQMANLQELPPSARVNLEIATRQFDDALNTYESMMSSPDMMPEDLALFSVFENYLKISIGALNDAERPAAALKTFAKRSDVPTSLGQDVQSWIQDLEGLKLDEYKGEELATARKMITEAMEHTKSRSDRSNLVDFIVSITLLHRYLATGPEDTVGTAEAYYLLGVAESFVARSYWISEVDFLIEKAIRLAPQSDVAKRALAFLEEYTESEYRVTQARAVPEELQTNLEELRKLVNE